MDRLWGLLLSCWLSTACGSVVRDKISQTPSFISAEVGDDLHLTCLFTSQELFTGLLWMKQSVGEEPVSIASYYSPNTNFYNGFDKSGRFKLEGGANSFNLTISQTQTTDSATYYCGSIFYADVTFGKGTVVFVKDRDSGDHAVIEQLDSVSPPSGGNVTLSCSVHAGSCEEEPAVFWFRPASADSRPGVAYSSRDNSCEYRLSRRNLSRADAHTHYCAVAACGRIVFGNGTRVHVQDDSSAPIPQLLAVSSLASALLMSLVVNVAFCVRARRSASQSGVSLCATCNAVVSAPGGAAAGRGQVRALYMPL
ncbi:immunoglobulin kappa light chain-like isoform X4 [Sardina pilchardus]|uniref:immunoglobulin kappa light chain-like isoform X4 n=1 Tax=Sardina pilchardus TaxID=27697 RepID=UPI002E13B56D